MPRLFYEDLNEGDEHKSSGRTITEADVVNFAGLSADYNNMHIDEEFAKKTVFKDTGGSRHAGHLHSHRPMVHHAETRKL